MISIRREISEIEKGNIAVEESALRHSPHTAEDIAGEWERKYSSKKLCSQFQVCEITNIGHLLTGLMVLMETET